MKTSINTLHHQVTDWLREMEFYKEEISVLTKRLGEAAGLSTDKDVAAQVEHFQNKFVILREQLDILKHDIGIKNHELQELAKQKPEHINEKSAEIADTLQGRVKSFTSSVADTRFEFNRFLSKVF
ncbi:MAG: hypothetical protein U0V74_05625 [Chitinophagales bacterium]